MSTLFAPRVPSVQPAFIYGSTGGTVKINYTLSEFDQGLTNFFVNYIVKDPTRSAATGTNEIAKGEVGPLTEASYIEIDFNEGLFLINQYYQVQIQIEDKEGNTSAWSQMTLIRPIEDPTLEIDLESPIEKLDYIQGRVVYKPDHTTVEAIQTYRIEIQDSNGKKVYKSGTINNTLGTSFATYLYDCALAENADYTLYFYYTTINGYSPSSPTAYSFHISGITGVEKDFVKCSVTEAQDKGGNLLSFTLFGNTFPSGIDVQNKYNILIQRTSEKENFSFWETILSINSYPIGNFEYTDLKAYPNTLYEYRVVFKPSDSENWIFKDDALKILTQLEHIYLLGDKAQLTLKYNPNISGFKYVTQESVTNTLGGKFPIVRINGDTKYRQFSLSGTLSFTSDYNSLFSENEVDSKGDELSTWIKDDNCTLLFNFETFFETVPTNLLPQIKNKQGYLEYKYRTFAMNFLTDQKPKVFRGANEDAMIVFLSGVSFTPNKQLSREVWDFSCTATEICQLNQYNLQKFGLDKDITRYKEPIVAYLLGAIDKTLDYYVISATENIRSISESGFEED